MNCHKCLKEMKQTRIDTLPEKQFRWLKCNTCGSVAYKTINNSGVVMKVVWHNKADLQ